MKRNRRGWRGNGERWTRVGKKGREREDEWARRDGETKKGKDKNKGKEQRRGRRKEFILLTYSACVRTFSARSLRSRTTVCKMGNPLQVEHKVTSNGLTLTRSYFVSTRHNHCTWLLDSIFNTFLKCNRGRGRRHCPWTLTSSLPSETETLSEMICSQLRSTCGTRSECSNYGMP